MSHLQAVKDTLPAQATGFTQLTTFFDEHNQIAWGYMHAEPRACFTHTLLSDYVGWFSQLARRIDDPDASDVKYMVIASSTPGVYQPWWRFEFVPPARLKHGTVTSC